MAVIAEPTTSAASTQTRAAHPVLRLLAWRVPLGLLSLIVIAVFTYLATRVLPGDAATAVLGQSATPERLAQLRDELGLNGSVLSGLWHWLTAFIHGDFGKSLLTNLPVQQTVGPKLANSAALVLLVAVASTLLGVVGGVIVANRRDSVIDHVSSVAALVAAALPEFVVGVFVILLLASGPLRLFPAVSILAPNELIWHQPAKLVLPAITLVIVVTPYMFRMVRAVMIESLDSDYIDLARMKGVSTSRMLFRHALPNVVPPAAQVFGLNLLYLAGGIVVVETVFQYPGIGLTLVQAITGRDIPVIQFLVMILATFYVVLNIATDVAVLLFTPRRRAPR